MISVVLPVFNEIKHDILPKIMDSLHGQAGVELLVVDGGSQDGTLGFFERRGIKVHVFPDSSRAKRLKKGLTMATGETVVFHHPRSVLDRRAWEWLRAEYDSCHWGGFTHRFDMSHWLLRFTSWYSNRVRSKRGILYLDHCLFFPKESLPDPEMIPDVEIFEDTEISKLLCRRLGLPKVQPFLSTTSAVRFRANGIFRQAILNQKMKWQYLRGRSDKSMNDDYEKDLRLNN